MIEVKVEQVGIGATLYKVAIQEANGGRANLRLTRDELTSLILQLTGQLARLDQEAQA